MRLSAHLNPTWAKLIKLDQRSRSPRPGGDEEIASKLCRVLASDLLITLLFEGFGRNGGLTIALICEPN
jgi:hypothetical protein